MSQIEYLVALISIIVGLGLADLARSFRELVRPDRAVRWHWLPLAWAAVVFLLVLQLWWASFRVLQVELFSRVLIFLPYLLSFLVLYLACSFALPDAEWESGSDGPATSALDLKEFYFSPAHRRWFFGILILLLVLGQVISTALAVISETGRVDILGRTITIAFNLGVAALFASLIVTRRWWVHSGVTVFVLGAVIYSLAFQIPALG
jgi:hypothetical protein